MKRWWILLVVLSSVLIMSGCDEGAATSDNANEPPPAVEPAGSSPNGLTVAANDLSGSAAQQQRMIIKDGNISLLVDDTDATLTEISTLAAQYGGYVIRSSSDHDGKYDKASIVIAVEADNFEQAMQDLRTTGKKLLRDSTSGEDVTSQYVDLESRLRNLEATRDRILTFLDQAQNAEEAILVNQQLTQIEGEIEQIKGQMQYLAGRAAYSTITVALREEEPASERRNSDNDSVREIIDTAISAQKDLFRLVVSLFIWVVIVMGPYLLIGGVIVWGWRRWRPRRADRSAAQPPEETNQEKSP
jgi:hypothetical protein